MKRTQKTGGKVTDIAVSKAKKLVRQHACPMCNNIMIDERNRKGMWLWICPHCDFRIYDHHLYEKHVGFLAKIIRKKIRERKVRFINKEG